MCTKAPSTVDYETDSRRNYLEDLDACLKRFNGALTATMNSYRDVLSAFDKMAQVYGNLAGNLKPEVKDPVIAMRDGMRDLKDKGPFVTFNTDLHEGTVTTLDPLRVDLKRAQKSLTELKQKQKDYDTLRNKIEKKEKEYSKKDKPLSESEGYKKDSEKLAKAKQVYEMKRKSFEKETTDLKELTEDLLMKSMNSYLHCTATFSGYLEATMNMYRTDIDENGNVKNARATKLDKAKEEVERHSVSRRRQTAQTNAQNAAATAAAAASRQQSKGNPSDPAKQPTSPKNSTSPQQSASSANHRNNSSGVPADDSAPMASSNKNSAAADKSAPATHKNSVVSNGGQSPEENGHLHAAGDDANEGGEKEYPSKEQRNPLLSE